MSKPTRLVWVLIAALAVMAISGCGSDDDDSSSSDEPARGFNVGDALKSACKKLGGNFELKAINCVFESENVSCVGGKITGSTSLKGFRCEINPELKQQLDRQDFYNSDDYKLLQALVQEKEDCLAKGPPWEWLEGANYCIQTKQ